MGKSRYTKSELSIVQHSLGVDQYGQGEMYRNHFASDPTPELENLVTHGLLADRGVVKWAGELHCYCVTKKGIRWMKKQSPAPPKVSRSQLRYRKWLDVQDCFGDMTFGEWLKGGFYKPHCEYCGQMLDKGYHWC